MYLCALRGHSTSSVTTLSQCSPLRPFWPLHDPRLGFQGHLVAFCTHLCWVLCRVELHAEQDPIQDYWLSSSPYPLHIGFRLLLDFIMELPSSPGHTTILVVVDHLPKMTHFVPCWALSSAQKTTCLFMSNIFHLHGLPIGMVSDWGSQFISQFWQELLCCLCI